MAALEILEGTIQDGKIILLDAKHFCTNDEEKYIHDYMETHRISTDSSMNNRQVFEGISSEDSLMNAECFILVDGAITHYKYGSCFLDLSITNKSFCIGADYTSYGDPSLRIQVNSYAGIKKIDKQLMYYGLSDTNCETLNLDDLSPYYYDVIKKKASGSFFVDNQEKATFGIVESETRNTVYLLGRVLDKDEQRVFRKWLNTKFREATRFEHQRSIRIGCQTEELRNMLYDMLGEKLVERRYPIYQYSGNGIPSEKSFDYMVKKPDDEVYDMDSWDRGELRIEMNHALVGERSIPEEYLAYVALYNGKVIGVSDLFYHRNGNGYISTVVEYKYWRKGIGTFLTQKLLENIPEKITPFVVTKDDEGTKAFLERNGFKKVADEVFIEYTFEKI